MIYNYFRWLISPLRGRYKVQPVKEIQKEFPLQKQDKQDKEELVEQGKDLEEKPSKQTRLSIWV